MQLLCNVSKHMSISALWQFKVNKKKKNILKPEREKLLIKYPSLIFFASRIQIYKMTDRELSKYIQAFTSFMHMYEHVYLLLSMCININKLL